MDKEAAGLSSPILFHLCVAFCQLWFLTLFTLLAFTQYVDNLFRSFYFIDSQSVDSLFRVVLPLNSETIFRHITKCHIFSS